METVRHYAYDWGVKKEGLINHAAHVLGEWVGMGGTRWDVAIVWSAGCLTYHHPVRRATFTHLTRRLSIVE